MIVTFCIILLIILLLLFIPVEIIFHVKRYDYFDNKVDAGFLFGLFRIRLYPKPKPEKPKKIKDVEEEKGINFRKYLNLLQNGAFLKKLLTLIQNSLKILKFKISKLHLRLGLDDPGDTGNLWSILGPVSATLGPRLTEDIFVENDKVLKNIKQNWVSMRKVIEEKVLPAYVDEDLEVVGEVAQVDISPFFFAIKKDLIKTTSRHLFD